MQTLAQFDLGQSITTNVVSLANVLLPKIPTDVIPQGRLLSKAGEGMRNSLSPLEVAQSLRQVTLPRISTLDTTIATFAAMGRHVPVATPIALRFSKELAGTSLQNN